MVLLLKKIISKQDTLQRKKRTFTMGKSALGAYLTQKKHEEMSLHLNK